MSDDIFVADSLNQNPVNISGTPAIRDGWPVFSHDNHWVYYSSMDTGNYCVYRVKKDGTEKVRLTNARSDDEDARVSPSWDGKLIIYNKQHGGTLGLRELLLPL
jgi:Tol biopolymer transport system component